MKTLEITTYIGCPVDCEYCAQATLKRAYVGNKYMTLEDFSKILDNTPKDVRIDFSGFSEIFEHPEASKFILMAADRGYQIVLYTTLNGFSESDLRALKGVRFAEVVFHQWPKAGENFRIKMAKFEINIQMGRLAVIEEKYKWSRAGNVWHRNYMPGSFECLFAKKDFDHNVVLPNGDVYLCCQDYGLKHRIGNLLTTKYDQLDRSQIISMSYQEDGECICRFCEIMQKC